QEAIARRYQGTILNYHLAMSAGDQARLHFYLSAPRERIRGIEATDLEADIRQIIRSWDDRLRDALEEAAGAEEGERLSRVYAPAFADEYRAATLPELAVQDVLELERLRAEGRTVGLSLREPAGREREGPAGVSLLNLYLVGERLVLSDFMPTLDHAGLRVVEVTPYAVAPEGVPPAMIYSFAVQAASGDAVPLESADLLAEMLLA